MKKQSEKTQKKLSLKKLQMISITNLKKIRGGEGNTTGSGGLGQGTSIAEIADFNNKY